MIKVESTFLIETLLLLCLATAARPNQIPTSELDAALKAAEARGFSGIVLVDKGGKIVFSKGYGLADRTRKTRITEDTQFLVGSLAKQFTAAAILKLEMKRKLNVNDLISKYFPVVPPDKRELTIHHLLTHTSDPKEQLFYGYGWVIDKTQNTNLVWHNGGWFGFFADMRRYLDRDLAVIFLTNTPGAMAEQTEEKVLNILLAPPVQQK